MSMPGATERAILLREGFRKLAETAARAAQ